MKKCYYIFSYVFIMMVVLMSFCAFKVNADMLDYDPDATYVYTTTVDDPITLDGLASELGIVAIDEIYGIECDTILACDCAEYVNNVLNKPAACLRELGEYNVSFMACDSKYNVSKCDITINVIDNVAPRVLEDYCDDLFIFEKQMLTEINCYQYIYNNIVALDSHDLLDLNFDVEEKIIEPDIVSGDYELVVLISDKSANTTRYTINVRIIDDIRPYFTLDKAFVLVDAKDKLLFDDVVAMFNIKAYDSLGVMINHTLNSARIEKFIQPGVFPIEFEAIDSHGEKATLTVYVEVISDKGPQFYFGNYTDLVVCKGFKMNDDDILSLISLKLGREDFTIEVLSDDYTENYDECGTYEYRVNVNYSNGESEELLFNFNVIEREEVSYFKLEGNFIQKTYQVIKKIGQIMINTIKWPINKIVTLFR